MVYEVFDGHMALHACNVSTLIYDYFYADKFHVFEWLLIEGGSEECYGLANRFISLKYLGVFSDIILVHW